MVLHHCSNHDRLSLKEATLRKTDDISRILLIAAAEEHKYTCPSQTLIIFIVVR